MKKITSILAFVLALSVFSCTKEGLMTINEITDHYTAPTDATVMNLSKAESTWSLDRRYFKLDFGNDLVTTLVGYDALLTPGQYVLGADAIGNAIDTKVKGAAAQAGYVLVTQKDGKYQVTGTFGDQILYWEGSLPFTPDPAPKKLTVLQQTQKNPGLVTMQLATEGIAQQFDMTTYQNVWTGEGGYLALDLYSEDGYLHDGNYTACAVGGVVEPGQFGIGYDTTIEYTGWDGQPAVYEAKDWGTCWWEVADGKATATKITGGLVTVTSREETVDDKDVTIWTIFWGLEYPQELLFEGAIPALTKPKPVAKDPDYLYTEVVTPDTSFDLHAITITDKQGSTVAYLELLTEPGASDLSGSYASTSYAGQPGQMRDGYDGGSMEYNGQTISWPGGGSYYVQDGEQHYLYKGTATVVVSPIATGAYSFTCEFFSYAAAGPDYVPSGGGDGEVLTDFLSLTSYAGYGIKLAGVELATSGFSYTTVVDWSTYTATTTYSGDGKYVKLEYYCEDAAGYPAPGTYTACAEGGKVGEGEFGIGYDPGSGAAYGSNWYVVTGGEATNQYITDGTLTVEKSGDTYTIILKSSVVNFKYVGPLSK